MASRNLEDLEPEVADAAHRVLEVCTEVGIDLLIYCTLRSPAEQARLYRQSRSIETIMKKVRSLRARGFDYLAEILLEVGPQSGPHVTNAGPGESFHNYGLAFDAVPMIGGKPAWNYLNAREQWDAYGECVRQVGLEWAGDWVSFREYPHAQRGRRGNPLKTWEAADIRRTLESAGFV